MSISFSGIASGLDTSSWIESLVALRRAKITTLQTQREELVATQDTLNNIRSFFNTFKTTVQKITDSKFGNTSSFGRNIATSSNLGVLSATVNSLAQAASYQIKVDQLATKTTATSGFKETITEESFATNSTFIRDLGGGINITDGMYIKVENSYGASKSIGITNSTTIGSLLNNMRDFGLNANIDNDGVITVSNGAVIGGTQEILNALGFTSNVTSTTAQTDKITYEVTANVDWGTKLGEIINALGTQDEVASGYNLYFNGENVFVTDQSTLYDIATQISVKGGAVELDANGQLIVNRGSLTGTVAEALGFTTSSSSEQVYNSATSNDPITYQGSVLVQGSTLIGDLDGVTSTFLTVYRSNGGSIATITYDSSDSIESVFAQLEAYGIDASITDGRVSITTDDSGNFVRVDPGNLFDALGITVATSIHGISNTSSAEITYTKTVAADGTTKLSDLGLSGNQTIKINESYVSGTSVYNTSVTTLSFGTEATLNDVFDRLGSYGIEATIEDGVISIDDQLGATINTANTSTGLLKTLGMTITTTRTTIGIAATSTEAIRYGLEKNITLNTKLGDIITDADFGDGVLTISGPSPLGEVIATVTATADMTISTLLSTIETQATANGYTVSASLTDGRIIIDTASLISDYSQQVSGDLATYLSLSFQQASNDATRLISPQLKSKDTISGATAVSLITGSTSDLKVQIKNGGNNQTITIQATDTVAQMLGKFKAKGFTTTISGGKITIEGGENLYITAATADNVKFIYNYFKLGSTYQAQVKSTMSSSQKRSVEETFTMDESTTLADLGVTSNLTLNITKDGVAETLTFTSGLSVGGMLNQIEEEGFEASVTDGKLTITGNDSVWVNSSGNNIFNSIFKMNGSSYVSGDTHNVAPDDLQYYQGTVTANASTSLGDLGLAGDATITVVQPNNGNAEVTITLSPTDTMGAVYITQSEPLMVESKFLQEIDRIDTSTITALSSMSATTALADGTYKISTTDELVQLSTMTNAGYISEGDYFVLAGDLDMTGVSWTMIGNSSQNFKGTFDGNGYTISGMTNALFGYTNSGSVIKNLAVDVNITSGSSGGIAYYNTGTISNAVTSGTMGSSSGGIAYYNSGTISNAVMFGTVSGSNSGGIATQNTGTISNAVMSGTVSGSNSGGIARLNSGTISNAVMSGIVSGSSSSGIAHQNSGTISNAVMSGTMSGNNSGGIAFSVKANSAISNCHVLSENSSLGAVFVYSTITASGVTIEDCTYNSYYDNNHIPLYNGTPAVASNITPVTNPTLPTNTTTATASTTLGELGFTTDVTLNLPSTTHNFGVNNTLQDIIDAAIADPAVTKAELVDGVLRIETKDGFDISSGLLSELSSVQTQSGATDSLVGSLANAGVGVEFNNGILTFTNSDSGYIKSIDPTLQDIFNIEYDEDSIYTESDITANISDPLVTNNSTNLSTSTKLTDLGVTTGDITLNINGEEKTINISVGNDKTIQDFLDLLGENGITARIEDGRIILSADADILFDTPAAGASNILEKLGLNNLAWTDTSEHTSKELKVISTKIEYTSAANFANENTTLKTLGITAGELLLQKGGTQVKIDIDPDKTFSELNKDGIEFTFDNGHLKISAADGKNVYLVSSASATNFASITGLNHSDDGSIIGSKKLYRVNENSYIVESGIFRDGDVNTGSFMIGNQQITIDVDTTIKDVINQINSSDQSNATARWDANNAKLVLESRSTGSGYINIGSAESGGSNFTDILGFTKDNNLVIENQEKGKLAEYYIGDDFKTAQTNVLDSTLTGIEGVTINLKGLSLNGEYTTLTIEKDKETVADAVSDMIDSYNEVIEKIDKEIAKGSDSRLASTLKLLKSQIRSFMTGVHANDGNYNKMYDIGISTKAGTAGDISTNGISKLSFDKEKFMQAYSADSESVEKLLVGTDANKGVLWQLEDVLNTAVGSTTGYFSSTNNSYNKQISRLDERIRKAEKDISIYRQRLENKFNSMELLITKMQDQYSSFLNAGFMM